MIHYSIEESVDLALKSIREEGLTDVFGLTLDIDFIDEEIVKRVKADLKKRDFSQFHPGAIHIILVPKTRAEFDYRRCALMSPVDTLVYLALAIFVAPKLEAKKIPTGDRVVFSHRFSPNGGKLFSDDTGYGKWLERHAELRNSPGTQIIVSADVSSFFDRLNHHRLQNALAAAGVDDWAHQFINGLLGCWANKDSYGIPTGSNASRILAEAALLDIDLYLRREGIQFIRYVDDFKLYAPDGVTAQKWLNKLIWRLAQSGLSLNASKTRIREKSTEEAVSGEVTAVGEEVLRTILRTTGSRYSRAPRRFTMPASEKHSAFLVLDLAALRSKILDAQIVDFVDVSEFFVGAIVQGRFDFLELAPELMRRCVQATDYLADMLTKNAEHVPPKFRARIAQQLERLLESGDFDQLDWQQAVLLRLLGTQAYDHPLALQRAVQSATAQSSPLPKLIALEGLRRSADRTYALTVRDLYDRVDPWSRRRIVQIVSNGLPRDEAKPWIKAKLALETDLLTRAALSQEKLRSA